MLKEFINKYNYSLATELIFNSYRTGKRSEVRDYDSISVTEILGLIEDPTMKFVKSFYAEDLKEAQDFGTKTHKELEDYGNKADILSKDNKLHLKFRKALIQRNIKIISSEKTFSKTYGSLPIITGTIDMIGTYYWKDILIDYKTSRTKRNFVSIKYELQKAGYRWLSGIRHSGILYLNTKKYEFKVDKDAEYYDKLWLELLNYADYLYSNGYYENLHKT